ncbi:class I SAM-dependent methyltransferase [Candidatus Bipolaricaulota bacterium]
MPLLFLSCWLRVSLLPPGESRDSHPVGPDLLGWRDETMTIEEDTKRFYNATADEVADKWYPNDLLMPVIRKFLSYLPPKPRVLDLGCGPGHESMRLASAGARVLGLDFSEGCINLARKRCPQCQFEVADFRTLDTRFGKFHGVFAAASIIHVSPDDLANVMDRIAGVLKNAGHLLAILQDGHGVRERWPIVDGQMIRRIVYLHRHADLASASTTLVSCRELELADELVEQDWRAHLFRLSTTPPAM